MNYYFQYDKTTGDIYSSMQESSPASSDQIGVLGPYPVDSASADVILAYNYPQRYRVVNGALTLQPYLTLTSDGTTVTATLHNAPSTPPTNVTFTVCGTKFTATLGTDSTASATVNIHPSISGCPVSFGVDATGCVGAVTQLGGSKSPGINVAAYQSTDGVIHVAPTGAGAHLFLAAYWQGTVSPETALVDLATIDGMSAHTVYSIILPALVKSGAVTLTDDEANALADIQANVLPAITTTLANAAPKPASGATQTFDMHYSSYRGHVVAMQTAINSYVNDLKTIPNLS